MNIKFLQILPTSQVKIVIFSEYRLYVYNFGAFSKFSWDFRSKIDFFQIVPTSQVKIMIFLEGWLDTKYSGPLGPLSLLGYEGHMNAALIAGVWTIYLSKLQP